MKCAKLWRSHTWSLWASFNEPEMPVNAAFYFCDGPRGVAVTTPVVGEPPQFVAANANALDVQSVNPAPVVEGVAPNGSDFQWPSCAQAFDVTPD